MWGDTTVSTTSFSAISGNVGNDTNVTFSAYKGGGTTNPGVYSNAIRLYQNASGYTAGYVVIGVAEGYSITSVTIKSTSATTTGYLLSDSAPASTPAKNTFNVNNYSLNANTDYTVSDISTRYITFACFGTTSDTRLNLSKISVTYTSTASKKNTALTLSPTSLDLSYGGSTGSLTATVTPEGGSALVSPSITWESDDESVATVDDGVVTPVGEGSATITATYDGDESYKGSSNTATVTVTDTRTAVVSAISSICSQKTLYIGGEIAFAPSVTLADGLSASDVTYSYVSADPTTIQINGNGTYTVLKTGTNIDITVTATPIAAKLATHKPVSATFQHNGAYRYSKPVFTPTGVTEGNFSGSMTLEMANDGTPTGPIYYTTDGTEPAVDKSNCTLYESSLTLTSTTTVKARVIDANGLYSTVTTATYTKVPVNKDAITLAAGQTLSFTNFSGLGDYGTDKATYVLASDGDKYKFTSTNVGYYSSAMQIKNEASAYTTLSPVTSTNGFKMTVTTTQNSVKVYVGETEKTAVNGVYYFSSGDAVTLKRSGGTTKVSNITFTGLKPSRSVTFPDGNQPITVDGSTITKTATVSPAGTATYSSSDTNVATVNVETGEVTAVKGGTAVITATVAEDEDYEKSTGSYTVTVNKAATTLSFAEDEITVELVDGTDAGQTATASPTDGTRVITYSTEADGATVNSSTGALTFTKTGDFTIKANATATDKYLAPSEASYTLHVQDSRVPIVSAAGLSLGLTDVLDAPIALNAVTKDDEGFLAASYTLATGFSGTEEVTYSSSDATVFKIENGNEFTALKGGTATVTVTITSGGNKMFTTVEKEFTVTVTNPSKTATEITVLDENTDPVEDGDVLNLTYGTPVVLDVDATSGYDGTISKVLSNSSIVGLTTEGTTVTITPSAVGSTTLTISAAETANYTAAETIVITINVTGAVAQTSTPVGDDYYYAYQEEITGGTNFPTGWTADDDAWEYSSSYGAVTKNTLTSGTYDLVTEDYDLSRYSSIGIDFDHTGKTFSTPSSACSVYVQEGDETPKKLTIGTYFGGGNFNWTNTGDIEIGDEYDGKTVHFIFRFTPTSGNGGKWEVKNFNVWGKTYPTTSVTIPSSGLATFCYQYPLDLDLLDEDAKAYIVTSVEGTNVMLKRITGTIKGGVPFILYGSNEEHTLYTAASSTTVPAGNLLVGTLAPTYITADQYYGLKGNAFVPVNAGTVPAGKALLPAGAIPASARELTFVFEGDETTGVKTIDNGQWTIDNGTVYDLQGRKVTKPVKGGLYIVNGKKVIK